jgi:hypothetical protein
MVAIGVEVGRVDVCAQHLKRLAMHKHDALRAHAVHKYELVAWVAIVINHMQDPPYATFPRSPEKSCRRDGIFVRHG